MKFNHESGLTLKIKNADIYFEETGDLNKDVLLFLHGGLGNIEDFNEMLTLLKVKYRIIGIDTRGHGKSTLGAKNMTYEMVQKDVEAVLESLGINKLSIIGFSDGGIVAYRLACFSQLEIVKLVTIGASWHTNMLSGIKNVLSGVTAEMWTARFPESVKLYYKINPQPDFELLVQSTVDMWLDEAESGHPDNNVKKITCQLLVIRGDKDHLVNLNAAFGIAEYVENVHLANIPFAGHAVFTEQNEILMNLINQFLSA